MKKNISKEIRAAAFFPRYEVWHGKICGELNQAALFYLRKYFNHG